MNNILESEISSSFQLRDELEAMVMNYLVGPAGGPEEIVAEPTVRGRYNRGILAPKGQTALLTRQRQPDRVYPDPQYGTGCAD